MEVQPWTGCFKSTKMTPGVRRGRFQVSLKDSEEEYPSPVTLYEDGDYMYAMRYKGNAKVTKEKIDLNLEPELVIVFMIEERTEQRIAGKYTGKSLDDEGTFELTPGVMFDPVEHACVIS